MVCEDGKSTMGWVEEEKEKGEEEKEKKFLQTGGHTDQSKVVQEVLMDLKMKKG